MRLHRKTKSPFHPPPFVKGETGGFNPFSEVGIKEGEM